MAEERYLVEWRWLVRSWRVVEAGGAVVARERGAVDDVVFTAGAGEATSTVALIATQTDVTAHSTVHTRRVRRAVVQVYNNTQNHHKHARQGLASSPPRLAVSPPRECC